MRFSDELIDDIREYKKTFRINIMNWGAVIENLKFLHDCCAASEELLEDAASRGPTSLVEYYRSHLEEERGELACLTQDLRSVGVVSWMPNPIAMALIGTQYYLLKHVKTVSLLGYMAVQEADTIPIGVVKQLEQAHGKDLFRFVRMHAIKDLEHRKELIEVIDSVPEPDQRFIVASAHSTLQYLAKAMAEIYG